MSSSSHSTSSVSTFTFLSAGNSSVQRNKSNHCLRLYKTTKMACREYVAVEPMEYRETLFDYASRFTGALSNAFPDLKTDTCRDLIDVFIEGVTRMDLMRVLDIKDEKCVKSSRTPFSTFISRVRGEI